MSVRVKANISESKMFLEASRSSAKRGTMIGEVPVGVVFVLHYRIIASGFNCTQALTNPMAHAEMLAILSASKLVKHRSLPYCSLISTAEPCSMCFGMMLGRKVGRLTFPMAHQKQLGHLDHSPIKKLIVDVGCSYDLKTFFRRAQILKAKEL
ncbi:tRNA-specific adenosine deaminase [Candidatus Tremblaya phenacola PAVE]|nr:tRNA-specific adenosine deaminase [Candidatus Tremblaya phenacola PAVE]